MWLVDLCLEDASRVNIIHRLLRNKCATFEYPHSSLWIITDYLYKNEVIYVVNFEKKCIIFFSLQCITYVDMLVYLHTFKVLQRAFIYFYHLNNFFVVQLLWLVWLFVTPWTAACQASLPFTNSQSLFILMSMESVMPSNHLILCHPLFLLPSIFPSIRVFLNESILCIRWPKYWSLSFSISPSNEYSGLISFRMD